MMLDPRRCRSALACVSLALSAGCTTFGHHYAVVPTREEPGTARHAVAIGGTTRYFLMHVPSARPRGRFGREEGYPVVILMHGSNGSGDKMRRMTRMDSIADIHRFLAVYPEGSTGPLGLQSDWNAGDCCGPAARSHVDDVAFLRGVIATIAHEMPIDRRRIYVGGFSDGGRMAYRAACEMGAEVAAFAVISGSLVVGQCAPGRPVPLVAFHGTADDQVAFDEQPSVGKVTTAPADSVALPPSVRYWAASNGCRSVTATRQSPHVTRDIFRGCSRGGAVEFFAIDQGGHGWPGDGDHPGSSEVDASALITRFFLEHALP